jgi:hypothetical protein
VLHYLGLCFLALVDVKGFLQVIKIPNCGPIADVDEYFIYKVWREMQHDIVG